MPEPENRHELVGKSVVYGLRPEDVSIGAGPVLATVRIVEPTGPETLLITKVGSLDVVMLSRDRIRVQPGDQLRITPAFDRIHLFDKSSGTRL